MWIGYKKIELENLVTLIALNVVVVRMKIIVDSFGKFIGRLNEISARILDVFSSELSLQSEIRSEPVTTEVAGNSSPGAEGRSRPGACVHSRVHGRPRGELLRDPNDPRRRGVRWEDISLLDGSMDVYRKKQQWDAASLPDPVISPLRSYRKLMAPPTDRWPVFPTFDRRTLATLIEDELADRGEHPEAIEERREEYVRDLLLALDEDIRPPSSTTDGARSILQRLSEAADIDIRYFPNESRECCLNATKQSLSV